MTERWPFDAHHDDDARPPTAAELRDEEAELARLGVCDPLSPAEVDTLVHRALREQRVRCFTKRRLLVAAMLLCTLASVAWMGARVVWAEGNQAPLKLPYNTAILAATDPTKTEQQAAAAVMQIDERCGYAAESVQTLAADPNAAVASRAKLLRVAVARMLATRPSTPPEPVAVDPLTSIAAASNRTLATDLRIAALDELESSIGNGVTAILVARDERITTATYVAQVRALIERLEHDWGSAPTDH